MAAVDDDTPSSVYSQPSNRPSGVSGFNLRAVIKDSVLQDRLRRSDPSLTAAIGATGVNLNARIGGLVRHPHGGENNEDNFIVMESYKVSCESEWGELDPLEDYVGMVLYSLNGETDWHLNGRHCKSGYIYFRKTSDINSYQSEHGQVHGKLYVSLFGEDITVDQRLVASGFAIRRGLQWRFNSGTFNHWQRTRHTMSRSEQAFVKKAIEKFAETGEMVHVIADYREVYSAAAETATHLERMLIAEGQKNLPARGTGRSTVHFEIIWRRRNKSKSIYMRKPIHYLVHQLKLDIQACTGFKAGLQQLFLDGVELQWYRRLGRAGLQDGAVLLLELRPSGQEQEAVSDMAAYQVRRLLEA